MNKYEKLLTSDNEKKESVLKILRILNTENVDDAKIILDCAKNIIGGFATFDVSIVETWLDSLQDS